MPSPDWLTQRPVAHRGLHDPARGPLENTLAAADAAARRGFAIEVDLVLSSDCEAMVFHDATLDRLTFETGPVARLTAAELAALPLRGSDQHIPTLTELIDTIAGRVPLIAELKPAWGGRAGTWLAERTAEVIAGRPDQIALMSFDPDIVAELGRLTPDRPRGVTVDESYDAREYPGLSLMERFALATLLHLPRSRPDFLAVGLKALTSPPVRLAKRVLGLPVLAWTVTRGDRARAAAFADQIIFERFDPAAGA